VDEVESLVAHHMKTSKVPVDDGLRDVLHLLREPSDVEATSLAVNPETRIGRAAVPSGNLNLRIYWCDWAQACRAHTESIGFTRRSYCAVEIGIGTVRNSLAELHGEGSFHSDAYNTSIKHGYSLLSPMDLMVRAE